MVVDIVTDKRGIVPTVVDFDAKNPPTNQHFFNKGNVVGLDNICENSRSTTSIPTVAT